MTTNKTQNRIKGNLGEEISCRFLQRKGFQIITRNYRKKWGELDIVARETMKMAGKGPQLLHFFEVKSAIFDLEKHLPYGHRPEDNVHGFKVKQLRKMIQTYLIETGRGVDSQFLFHILSVSIDPYSRKGRVKWIKDIIL